MKARVTVLQPSDGLVYKWNRKRTKRMPLGMAYIATAALRKGHEVNIVDASLEDLTVEETVERAPINDPHVVGITCTTPLFHLAMQISHKGHSRANIPYCIHINAIECCKDIQSCHRSACN